MTTPFFDTNILIDWLRDLPQAAAELARHERHRISRIVWTELLAGEPITTHAALERLIAPFEVVEVDEAVARQAAAIRSETKLKLLDALILATALVHDADLVTRNTRDYPADQPGIRVPYTL